MARKARLGLKAVEAARPRGSEYTLWDGSLPHFGLRVHPSGRKSYIVQTRAQGRMRKITLGRFPELGLTEARRDAAAVLARVWAGENVAPARKARPPRFRDFEAVYRERKRHQWKPSSLATYDIYIGNRVMTAFGRFRLDTITHARVSTWFDAISAEKPGGANRAFEILRAMLRTAPGPWDSNVSPLNRRFPPTKVWPARSIVSNAFWPWQECMVDRGHKMELLPDELLNLVDRFRRFDPFPGGHC